MEKFEVLLAAYGKALLKYHAVNAQQCSKTVVDQTYNDLVDAQNSLNTAATYVFAG